MNRLTRRLELVRAEGRLLLVGYLPAGYPGRPQFSNSVREAFAAGVDAMEIALPNPPLPMDGPLIQDAVRIGAQHVLGAQDALEQAVSGRVHGDEPVVALAYRAAFEALGAAELYRTCALAGVDAVLLPQHSLVEQLELAEQARARGLEQVLFIYLEEDLALLGSTGLERPVVYLQSADVQTGGRFNADKAVERLGELRAALGGRDAFVLVGFGVRGHAEAAALVDSSADGVIVGTAMVEAVSEGPGRLHDLVRSIVPALPRTGEKVPRG